MVHQDLGSSAFGDLLNIASAQMTHSGQVFSVNVAPNLYERLRASLGQMTTNFYSMVPGLTETIFLMNLRSGTLMVIPCGWLIWSAILATVLFRL